MPKLRSCFLSLFGGHKDEINCLVFSSDLEILLSGSIDGCIRIWNTVLEHLTLKIFEAKGRIRALTISNNDRYFASTANDPHVRLYETRTGSLLYSLTGHTHPSDGLQFSSDSRLIASGGWDCRTIVWDVLTGVAVYHFSDHTDAVQSIAFHPKKNLMASGSYDHDVRLYNLESSLTLKPAILRGHMNNVRALAFSSLPYLASAGWDKIILIWHIESIRIHSRLFGHSGWIQAIAFRNGDDDGCVLASIDDDSVWIWNIISGLCLQRLPIHNDLSCFTRFLPNNRRLLVGGAIYEVLVPSVDRQRAKYVYEPVAEETKLLSLKKKD